MNLQVITNAVCSNTFGNTIVASTLCTSGAGGVGTCGGDSGGPLTVGSGNQRTLVSIILAWVDDLASVKVTSNNGWLVGCRLA